MAGLVLVVVSDLSDSSSKDEAGKNPLLGDAFVVIGATLYAASNVWQEAMVIDCSIIEVWVCEKPSPPPPPPPPLGPGAR